MRDRRPVGLLHVPGPAATQIARLSGVEGFARAVMVGSVPLAALEALGSKQAVSYAFLAGSVVTVAVTVNVARFERVVPRRWILTLGGIGLFLAAVLFAFAPGWTMPAAIALRASHASVFSVCLSLYLMDSIAKGDLVRAESRRAVFIAGAWLIGPALGTWLWSEVGSAAPFLASMALTLAMLAYHWRLRFEGNEILRRPVQPPARPVASIVRFFRHRNLRIAYAITCIRSTFWAALFIYGPIYVVEAGYPEWAAGVFLSVASAVLFLGPLVHRSAERWGVRTNIMAGFALITVGLCGLALVGDPSAAGIGCWMVAAVGGGMIDVLGNIPFIRMVRPRERSAMASVFSTWREVSFTVAPALAALVLWLGPFRLLYVALAVLTALGVVVTSYLPRRL